MLGPGPVPATVPLLPARLPLAAPCGKSTARALPGAYRGRAPAATLQPQGSPCLGAGALWPESAFTDCPCPGLLPAASSRGDIEQLWGMQHPGQGAGRRQGIWTRAWGSCWREEFLGVPTWPNVARPQSVCPGGGPPRCHRRSCPSWKAVGVPATLAWGTLTAHPPWCVRRPSAVRSSARGPTEAAPMRRSCSCPPGRPVSCGPGGEVGCRVCAQLCPPGCLCPQGRMHWLRCPGAGPGHQLHGDYVGVSSGG
jgi:hypothetical protein